MDCVACRQINSFRIFISASSKDPERSHVIRILARILRHTDAGGTAVEELFVRRRVQERA